MGEGNRGPNSRSLSGRVCRFAALACSFAGLAAPADNVLPSLAYGSLCSSTVVLQNLADTPVAVELEAHRSSGALVLLAGLAGRMIHLAPGEQGEYQLQIQEEEKGAWVQVRERAAARATPSVAVERVHGMPPRQPTARGRAPGGVPDAKSLVRGRSHGVARFCDLLD